MIHTSPGTAPVLDRLRKQPAGRKLARTLAASRYIDFPNGQGDNDWRRRICQAIKDGSADTSSKLASWRSFAIALAGPEKEQSPNILFARQQSRLLVNLAGGVFENGGLSLDRLSGLPVIPGSAVKGCARRLALAALQEWSDGQLIPDDPENLLAPAIAGIDKPSDLLYHIALIFGWSDLEWQGSEDFDSEQKWQEKRPDFAFASGNQWPDIRKDVSSRLCAHLHITPKDNGKPWKSLPHSAGTISFLPAHPWEKDPGIELDVLTCHHGEYYKGNIRVATDTEEPVPVIFPAIAPGQNWAFLLQPTTRGGETHLKHARRWLAHGLEVFGIGAKTNAGYGWFDASEAIQTTVKTRLKDQAKRWQEEVLQKREEEHKRIEQEQRRQKAAEEEAATRDMTPEQKADYVLAQFTSEQFRGRLDQFAKREKTDQEAMIRALRLEPDAPNSRRQFWNDLKQKAQRGGKPAQLEQTIRQVSKQMNLGKMP